MLLHDSPVWSFLRGTVSVQGQAVVLASTTLRRQSCCRSEVLTSSRIADLVDTSSGEALMVASPVSCPLFGWSSFRGPGGCAIGPCADCLDLVDTSSGEAIMVASPVSIPLQGKPSWWPPRYLHVGSSQGSLGRWVTLSSREPSWGPPGCVLSFSMVPVGLCLEVPTCFKPRRACTWTSPNLLLETEK